METSYDPGRLFRSAGPRLHKIDKNGDPLAKINETVSWERCFVLPLKRPETRAGSPLSAQRGTTSSCCSKFLSCSRCTTCRMTRSSFRFSTGILLGAFLGCTSVKKFLTPPPSGVFGKTSSRPASWRSCLRPSMRTSGPNGFMAMKGQIVDASIVNVPKQQNSREENARIKEGKFVSANIVPVEKLVYSKKICL